MNTRAGGGLRTLLSDITMKYSRGFRGFLNWALVILREASHSFIVEFTDNFFFFKSKNELTRFVVNFP